MRPRPIKLNLPQNLFSVYLREALCYDEVARSENFGLDLKTKSPKTEVLGLESDDVNRESFAGISVNLSLSYTEFSLLGFQAPYNDSSFASDKESNSFTSKRAVNVSRMQENVARLYL